ncbi:hypothetical protein C7C46_10130 [Streptomyces tateyamensis]|uniref:Uncharacterized protein n=1 Tax=Streptomyces tateyamensis TaxID=565073 RepID=A0A2V4PCH2_9ACTN|nr:hypothetical protein C7C46_10130 [Streptomyces tateyamensis]
MFTCSAMLMASIWSARVCESVCRFRCTTSYAPSSSVDSPNPVPTWPCSRLWAAIVFWSSPLLLSDLRMPSTRLLKPVSVSTSTARSEPWFFARSAQ